ncbi:hypothetical protein VTO73DRAFT_11887 [Trametes versicolor]
MSNARTAPSLSGVLIVLNIVLALVWVSFFDSIDPANVFHALLIINATTTAWWIWMNTSLSRHARALCRFAVSAVHVLGPPSAMLQASRRLSFRVGNARYDGTLVLVPLDSPPSPARCNRSETLVDEEYLDTPEDADVLDEQLHEEWSSAHPTALILHRSRSSTPSHSDIQSIHKLSLDDPIPISNLAPSRASLSDAQLPENVRLNRAVRILTRERDLYRSRAYQLSTRLDECYSTHAQTRCALERAESAAIDTQHALQRLEAERRDLSLALAATLTAPTNKAEPSTVPPDYRTTTQDIFAHHPRPSADDLSSPQTPVKHSSADERPLLLPPTAETTEDTPTRPRNATWASPGRSRLEDILMHTRRRAEVLAQAQKRGSVGAVWDAQRAASARPIFSVVHEGSGGDRAGMPGEEIVLTLTAEQKNAYGIIEDLRVSRPCTSPSTSPVLEQEDDNPAVTVSEEVPRKQEEAAQQTSLGMMTAQKPSSDTLTAQPQNPVSDTLAVPMQAMPVRQPRGPPPSPLATLAQKALAQALQRPSAHTWRGRTQGGGSGVGADADAKLTLGRASTSPDPPATTYPTSRMPSRVHARQATAPPGPTSMGDTEPQRIDPMVILHAALPASVPKVAVSSMTEAVGGSAKPEERRRHATYSGAGASGSPAFASTNLRWQASASGREAIEAERRVAETAEEINLLLRGLLHKASSRTLVAEPVVV